MSLQVWLPLNGDLHNQGLSGLTATNNGATVNNNGKIGKCYSFNGSSNLITLDSCSFSQKSQWSICAWLYPNTSSLVGFFGCRGNSSGSSLYQLSIAYSTGSDAGYSLMYRDNNTSSPAKFTFASSITASIWQHWVFTYNNGLFSAYKDGLLLNTYQSTGSTMNLINLDISIGCNRAGSPQGYFNGRINDFRIYDHALSPKEVEEIAKGLVLHYKLDDPYVEGTTNLWKTATSSSTPRILSPYAENNTNAYINDNITSSVNPYGNNKITISMDITNNTNVNYWFRARTKTTADAWTSFVAAQSTAYAPPGKTTRVYQTFDWSSGMDGASIYLRHYFGKQRGQFSPSEQIIISHIQVEIKDHLTPWVQENSIRTPTTIYDSSGYNHIGTITGNLAVTKNSIKYTNATFLNGIDTYITSNSNFSFLKDSPFTIALWAYCEDWTTATTNNARYLAATYLRSGGGFCIWSDQGVNRYSIYWRNNSDTTKRCYFSDAGALTSGWAFFAATYDGATMKTYLNGNYYATTTADMRYLESCAPFRIGAYGSSPLGTQALAGNYTDCRLYVSCLTESQIKELYNTSMSIDSRGNVYARELVEL